MASDITIPKPLSSGVTDVPDAPQPEKSLNNDDLPEGYTRMSAAAPDDLPPGYTRLSAAPAPGPISPPAGTPSLSSAPGAPVARGTAPAGLAAPTAMDKIVNAASGHVPNVNDIPDLIGRTGTQVGQNLQGMAHQMGQALTPTEPSQPHQPLVNYSSPYTASRDILTAGPRTLYQQAKPIVQDIRNPDASKFLGDLGTAALLHEAGAGEEGKAVAGEESKAVAAGRADFKSAIPPSNAHPYTDAQLDATRPYLEEQHGKSSIKTVEDARDAMDSSVKKIEKTISDRIAQNPNDVIASRPGDAARAALAPTEALKEGTLAAGMRELAPYHLDEPMTVSKADAMRRQLNAENDAYSNANKYTKAQARATNPAYAAREAAVGSLRDGIYDALSKRGFADSGKLRGDEGSLLAVRDATQNQIFNGEKNVAGTGAGKLGRNLAKAGATAAGAGLGHFVGGAPAGALVGLAAGEGLSSLFPGNMSRDALMERAFSNVPKITLKSIKGAAAPQTQVPAPLRPAVNPPRSLGAAAAGPAAEVPGALREQIPDLNRRTTNRTLMTPQELEAGIQGRKPVRTPFDVTEGANSTINRDRNMPAFPQGGHAGGGVSSVEELARPGKNYVVPQSGPPTYHGKSFAPESTPRGAAHVTVMPNGELRVNAGTLTPSMERSLRTALKAK